MKRIIITLAFIFYWSVFSYGIEITRISPGKYTTSKQNNYIEFSINASDPQGLSYSKWQVASRLQEKHILTGYSKNDKWEHSFTRNGIYYVNVTVYNINGESEILIWKVNIQNSSGEKPYITLLNPKSGYISITKGTEEVFSIEASDNSCSLNKVKWLVRGTLKETNAINGCSSKDQFSYTFYHSGNYKVCAEVYNRNGMQNSKCWTVDVSRHKEIVRNNTDVHSNDYKGDYRGQENTSRKMATFGFSYSTRTMIDERKTNSGKSFKDLINSNPTQYELFVRGSKGVIGSQIGVWYLDAGNFTQTGARGELLLNVGFSNPGFGINIYGGGGLVYVTNNFEESYSTKYEDKSFGYSYSVGIELVIGQKIIFSAEYNTISAKSSLLIKETELFTDGYNYYESYNYVRDLNVGSSGISFGIGYTF